jgi:hypothetical protein
LNKVNASNKTIDMAQGQKNKSHNRLDLLRSQQNNGSLNSQMISHKSKQQVKKYFKIINPFILVFFKLKINKSLIFLNIMQIHHQK